MARQYKVCKEFVLIRMVRKEKVSEGGIILEVTSREIDGTEEGYIEAMGEDAFNDYSENEKFVVGDKVMIKRYSGNIINYTFEDKEERRIIVDTGILAKIIED